MCFVPVYKAIYDTKVQAQPMIIYSFSAFHVTEAKKHSSCQSWQKGSLCLDFI